jgi:hypothetical protein
LLPFKGSLPFLLATVPAGRAALVRLAGAAGTVPVRTCWEVAGFRPRRAPRSRWMRRLSACRLSLRPCFASAALAVPGLALLSRRRAPLTAPTYSLILPRSGVGPGRAAGRLGRITLTDDLAAATGLAATFPPFRITPARAAIRTVEAARAFASLFAPLVTAPFCARRLSDPLRLRSAGSLAASLARLRRRLPRAPRVPPVTLCLAARLVAGVLRFEGPPPGVEANRPLLSRT